MSGSQKLGCALLAGAPLVALGLWLASGRETLTKAEKIVAVTVRDDLFGDTNTEQRAVSGPIVGHYIGLDAVILVAAAAGVTALVWWWLARRRRRGQPEGRAHAT
jgi:hypothetical protein